MHGVYPFAFSTLAGPPETDVASVRDAEIPGPGFWKETVFEFNCRATGGKVLEPNSVDTLVNGAEKLLSYGYYENRVSKTTTTQQNSLLRV